MSWKHALLTFEDGAFGWTEDYIWVDPGGGYGDVSAAADSLARRRLAMCNGNIVLAATKVSDDGVRGDSFLREYDISRQDLSGHDQYDSPDLSKSERPYSVLNIRFESTPNYHSNRPISGIPAAVISDPFNGALIPGDWAGYFNSWRSLLIGPAGVTAGPWGFRHHDLTAMAAAAKTFRLVDEANAAFLFDSDPGFKLGDQLYVLTYPGAKRLVGSQWQVTNTVTAAGTTTVTVRTPKGSTAAATAKFLKWFGYGGGTIAPYSSTVSGITDVVIRGATHRARGRPSAGPRGRRRSAAR